MIEINTIIGRGSDFGPSFYSIGITLYGDVEYGQTEQLYAQMMGWA